MQVSFVTHTQPLGHVHAAGSDWNAISQAHKAPASETGGKALWSSRNRKGRKWVGWSFPHGRGVRYDSHQASQLGKCNHASFYTGKRAKTEKTGARRLKIGRALPTRGGENKDLDGAKRGRRGTTLEGMQSVETRARTTGYRWTQVKEPRSK